MSQQLRPIWELRIQRPWLWLGGLKFSTIGKRVRESVGLRTEGTLRHWARDGEVSSRNGYFRYLQTDWRSLNCCKEDKNFFLKVMNRIDLLEIVLPDLNKLLRV